MGCSIAATHRTVRSASGSPIADWLAALDTLEAITREAGFTALVPGHGAVARDAAPIRQTRAWLRWR